MSGLYLVHLEIVDDDQKKSKGNSKISRERGKVPVAKSCGGHAGDEHERSRGGRAQTAAARHESCCGSTPGAPAVARASRRAHARRRLPRGLARRGDGAPAAPVVRRCTGASACPGAAWRCYGARVRARAAGACSGRPRPRVLVPDGLLLRASARPSRRTMGVCCGNAAPAASASLRDTRTRTGPHTLRPLPCACQPPKAASRWAGLKTLRGRTGPAPCTGCPGSEARLQS